MHPKWLLQRASFSSHEPNNPPLFIFIFVLSLKLKFETKLACDITVYIFLPIRMNLCYKTSDLTSYSLIRTFFRIHHCFTISRFSPLLTKTWPFISVVHNHFSMIIRIICAKFDGNWSAGFRKKSKCKRFTDG